MIDTWGTILYDASYGGFPIHVLSASDSGAGRALARHKYPHRDGVDIEDMGGEARVTRCRVIFTGPDHYEAFRVFHDLAQSIEPLVFVHPLTGSYTAKVGELTFEVAPEPRDTILVECTFEEDTTEPAAFPIGPGSPTLSGSDDVAASAAALTAGSTTTDGAGETGDIVLDPTIATDAAATAQTWENDDTKTIRDVTYELQALQGRIQIETDALEVATDLSQYQTMIGLVNLSASLRRAAQVFAARAPQLFLVTVEAPTPLMLIAAQIYGAAEAPARVDQLMGLNDIRNPMRVERGTVITAQAPTTSAKLRSPR